MDQIRLKINSKLTRPHARGYRAGTAIIKASAQAAELIHQSASASITQLQLLAASRHWVQHGASYLVLSPWGNRSNLQMMLTEQGHNALGKSQEIQDYPNIKI